MLHDSAGSSVSVTNVNLINDNNAKDKGINAAYFYTQYKNGSW
jgi:hypothetical protein